MENHDESSLALSSMMSVIANDFNNDNIIDLAVVNSSNDDVALLYGSCTSRVSTAITILSPNGGEMWEPESEQLVIWRKGEGIVSANIEISRDNGANWETIATNQTDTSFTWTVTNPTSSSALVRIYDPSMPGRADSSNSVFTIGTSTDIQEPGDLPTVFSLAQNYPNPFNAATTIKYEIPRTTRVQLVVYNTLGQEIETLVDEVKPAGRYSATIDLSNYSSGTYFYEIRADDFTKIYKMTLLK